MCAANDVPYQLPEGGERGAGLNNDLYSTAWVVGDVKDANQGKRHSREEYLMSFSIICLSLMCKAKRLARW